VVESTGTMSSSPTWGTVHGSLLAGSPLQVNPEFRLQLHAQQVPCCALVLGGCWVGQSLVWHCSAVIALG